MQKLWGVVRALFFGGQDARHELTDAQWAHIQDLFPSNAHKDGEPWKDHRLILNGMLYRLHTGCPWRDLPERYGPWQTVYDRFSRYRWERFFEILQRLFGLRGVPQFVRSDNAPELIVQALMRFLAQKGVACRHIEPGSPWQNGKNERFNGTMRSECLDLETFAHRDQARATCKLFQRQYNTARPHSALGYRTPEALAARQGPAAQAPASAAPRPEIPPQVPAGVH